MVQLKKLNWYLWMYFVLDKELNVFQIFPLENYFQKVEMRAFNSFPIQILNVNKRLRMFEYRDLC